MKHLKPYNESISKDILNDIEDILLELDDMKLTHHIGESGFATHFQPLGSNKSTYESVYYVRIGKGDRDNSKEYINWIDIKEVVLRLVHFFKLNDIQLYSLSINNIPYKFSRVTAEPIYLLDEAEIRLMKIEFYNVNPKELSGHGVFTKKFESLSTDNIISDLEDICVELKDTGHTVTCYYDNKYHFDFNVGWYPAIRILISRRGLPGTLTDKNIITCIKRMIYFMRLQGYNKFDTYLNSDKTSMGYLLGNLFKYYHPHKQATSVKINFYKEEI